MDRKGIAAVATCVVLLLAWFPLMRWLAWMPPPRPPAAEATALAPATPEPSATSPGAATPSTPSAEAPAATQPVQPVQPATPPPPPGPAVDLSAGNEMTARLDAQSGAVRAVTLGRFLENDRKTPMTLGSVAVPFGELRLNGEVLTAPAKVVEQTATRLVLERVTGTTGVVLRQEWDLLPDTPYQFRYRITLRNPGANEARVDRLSVDCGRLSLPAAEVQQGMGMPSDLSVDLAFVGETRPKNFAPKKIYGMNEEDRMALAARELTWAAVHTKYFVFYLSGGSRPLAGAQLSSANPKETRKDADPWVGCTLFLPRTLLAPGAEETWDFTGYTGPKEYSRLRTLGTGVESILQMDLFFFFNPQWMGAVSRVILQGMIRVHEAIGRPWGYGVAIILITVIVKLLFWPLTHYSTVSMKKLQVVQPQIQEIRKKYKDDAMKMNQKIMELYKENKVNPMGGCIPMVLQIPVFFALFNVFRGAIELRHAPFLWVTDLSQPDTLPWSLFGLPLRPLAILMAVTMYLQQKITPTAMDPTQAKMMTFMTIFFAFIFYSMPAGLTLYWTVNQGLGIVQTLITFRLVQHLAHVPAGALVRK